MLLDSIVMIIGFICISVAQSFELLLIGKDKKRNLFFLFEYRDIILSGRLLTGHSGGSHLVSSPIFVSEISHPDIRGTSSALTVVLYTSGFFISMLAGAALHWRLATGLFIITGVLSFVLLLFCKVINHNKCLTSKIYSCT